MSILYQSSTIDWCEHNYIVSTYVAEFLNSVSNIPLLYWGYVQYRNNNHRNNNRSHQYVNLLYLNYFIIWLSSIFFHITLSSMGQFFDETSILFFIILLRPNDQYKYTKVAASLATFIFMPNYNKYILSTIAIHQSYKIYMGTKTKKEQELIQNAILYLTYAMICWTADIFYCDYLHFSLHWIWHIFAGLGLLETLSYISQSTLFDDDDTDPAFYPRLPSLYEYTTSFVNTIGRRMRSS